VVQWGKGEEGLLPRKKAGRSTAAVKLTIDRGIVPILELHLDEDENFIRPPMEKGRRSQSRKPQIRISETKKRKFNPAGPSSLGWGKTPIEGASQKGRRTR